MGEAVVAQRQTKSSPNIRVFEERAAEYDGWFDDNPVFAAELLALQEVRVTLPHPRLEIGVGPGRFAAALGVKFGVDPALAPLGYAKGRGILPCRAMGEALPVRSGCLGTVFLLFTLCFVRDSQGVLAECSRVLRSGGMLIVGTVPLDSPWGRLLDGKRVAGHPFYGHARFMKLAGVLDLLRIAGFTLEESRSTLLQTPEMHDEARVVEGVMPDAGFVVLACRKG
jgi:SAM-dependent methyltransferase